MKSVKFAFAAFSLLMFAMFASCTTSDDNSSGGNNNNVTPSAGQWKVSYFFDKQDETSNYTGYTFEFGSNGSLTASKGGQTWSGTWQTGIDDSADKFLIDFTGTLPSELTDLEEDWLIIKIEDSAMHFEHTSGGNGDTDVLKFTKN
ncbi:MAG TPA: hypothetical protein PK228_14695 [Saprospiraceae bacterium]|nr:hypothetical protein [Saprospiraceae bacterium]